MCRALIEFLKIFIVYSILQTLLSIVYYYFIFDNEGKRLLASILVPLPLALSIPVLIFMTIYLVERDD